MSAALRGMLAAQDTHGNSRGLEGPSGDDCVGHTTRCVGRTEWHIGDVLATHGVSAALHVVLAAKDMGTPEGSRDPQGGCNIHEKFLLSRIAYKSFLAKETKVIIGSG